MRGIIMAIINLPSTLDDVLSFGESNDSVSLISDALVLSIRNKGRLNLDYMSSVTGVSKDEILKTLVRANTVFQNPDCWDGNEYSNWELASEYLSGNLFAKREKAQKIIDETKGSTAGVNVGTEVFHKRYGKGKIITINRFNDTVQIEFGKHHGIKTFPFTIAFREKFLVAVNTPSHPFVRNVEAINAVIPKCVSIDEIYVRLGAPWISTDFIDGFIIYLLGSSYVSVYYNKEELKTVHEEITGTWNIPVKSRYGAYDVNSTVTYGTNRINALHIIEKLLNNSKIIIYDYDSNGKPVLNKPESVAAMEKAKKIEEKFSEYIRSTPQRTKLVEQMYYSVFGSIKQRKFSGEIFEFPGMNPDVRLYSHQKDAFARCVLSPNTLLAHDVGAGKTYIMIAAAMEMKRMGISPHNMFVVPNNILGQWVDFFAYLYKDSKVLAVSPKDFTPARKQKTLTEMRDGDYDAVIIAYSCFDRLNLSKNTELEEIEAKLERIREALKKPGLKNVASLRRMEKRLKNKADKIITERKDSETVYFDDLGVTTLFIDEIHNYKNVSIDSHSMHRTHGVNSKGTAKNNAMLEKIFFVQRSNGGRGVIAATGTPVTNSITDLYIMQRFLQSGELALSDIRSFDEWIGAFARREDSFELDVDTSNYRITSRYNFHNVPELASLFSSIADFYTVSEKNLPSFDGYEEIVIPKTAGMTAFNKSVSERVEKIHKGRVKGAEDNLLKVTVDSIKACLDLRLIDEHALFTQTSKVYFCAKNVADFYYKHAADKLTQLVFCDISTPKAGFNIYDELRRILTSEFGIAADEIAFVHDATTDDARRKLFAKTRKGEIRILVGSTKKLGTGTNVQDKLVAIHHLDLPWTPADMNQREGRILRNGNTCQKVHIIRYITKGSFDAYLYQLLQQKQKFISEILQGCVADRDGRDVDLLLTYAEIKSICIDNDALKKRFEAENELSRCRMLKKKENENREILLHKTETLKKDIPAWTEIVTRLSKDSEIAAVQEFKGELQLREDLNRIISDLVRPGNYGSELCIADNYHGFAIFRPTDVTVEEPFLILRREGSYSVSLKVSKDNNVDAATRINNTIRSLPKRFTEAQATLKKLKERKEDCLRELKNLKDYDEEIRRLELLVERYDRELRKDEN